jgi:murein DD-endopeptidase MepM/ murein hydrolase activator NlpD
MHGGIDLANATGTPELAAAAGTVIVAGPAGGFGQWVQLRHDDGTVTVYGHMDTIEVVVGQQVAAGQLIATMGAQGNSTGPHLHFEVWPAGDRAQRIDPAVWLTERGVVLPEYTP